MTYLYQLELDQEDVNCGMSYVIHLDDGSFFLIDGGYFTPGEEERLYEFLVERSEGVPVISGWFFTHAHQDHVGNFIQFVWKYRDAVTIKKLLYHFHPVDLSDVTGDWKSSDPATIKEFYRTVDEYCADIEIVDLHTGDRMGFGELVVDVIYSYDDLYPTPSAFNDYSTVIRTTVGDQRILWLADASAKASANMLEDPAKLKCDIVQVAHHGIDNHDILCDVYAATGATVALWPVPDYGMAARLDQKVNHFILHDLGIREHLVSGYGTITLKLPYNPGTATKKAKAFSLDMQPDPAPDFDLGANSPYRYLTPDPIQP